MRLDETQGAIQADGTPVVGVDVEADATDRRVGAKLGEKRADQRTAETFATPIGRDRDPGKPRAPRRAIVDRLAVPDERITRECRPAAPRWRHGLALCAHVLQIHL